MGLRLFLVTLELHYILVIVIDLKNLSCAHSNKWAQEYDRCKKDITIPSTLPANLFQAFP
jgi:hypothetical protein